MRNLRICPTVHVEIGHRTFAGSARIVDGGPEDAPAQRLVYEKYRARDDLEEWRETALPVAIDLETEDCRTPRPRR